MTVVVSFAGNSYDIPEDEETGWANLTDFLVAVAQNAATIGATSFGTRIATTTPQTLQSTDTILCMNVGSASVVNLPAGVAKTVYGVFDTSGAANANPITVTPNGSEKINNASTYVIDSNRGGVLLHFNGSGWIVLAEFSDVFKTPRRIENNTTNTSFAEGAITANAAFASVTDGQSCSASFDGSKAILISVGLEDGQSVLLSTSYAKDEITILSDQSEVMLDSDAGTGLYVSKSAASSVVTFKSRLGATKRIQINALTNRLSSIAAWA